jgi:hypothetical protein
MVVDRVSSIAVLLRRYSFVLRGALPVLWKFSSVLVGVMCCDWNLRLSFMSVAHA